MLLSVLGKFLGGPFHKSFPEAISEDPWIFWLSGRGSRRNGGNPTNLPQTLLFQKSTRRTNGFSSFLAVEPSEESPQQHQNWRITNTFFPEAISEGAVEIGEARKCAQMVDAAKCLSHKPSGASKPPLKGLSKRSPPKCLEGLPKDLPKGRKSRLRRGGARVGIMWFQFAGAGALCAFAARECGKIFYSSEDLLTSPSARLILESLSHELG